MRFRTLSALAALSACALSASAAIFDPLFTVAEVAGDVSIVKPNGETAVMHEDFTYPFGSHIVVPKDAVTVRTDGKFSKEVKSTVMPTLVLALAPDFRFRFAAGSDFWVIPRNETLEDGTVVERVEINLLSGAVETAITARTVKTGGSNDAEADANLQAVIVTTPVGSCTRLAERNRVRVVQDAADPSMYKCTFYSQSGLMEIYGPEYKVSDMKHDAMLDISGNADFTSIVAVNGKCKVDLERGADAHDSIPFKSRCVAKIWRRHADVGGRKAIAVMYVLVDGTIHNYAYLEGQTNVGGAAPATQALDPNKPADASAAAADLFGGFDGAASSGGDSSASSSDASSGDVSFDFGDSADSSDSSSSSTSTDDFSLGDDWF